MKSFSKKCHFVRLVIKAAIALRSGCIQGKVGCDAAPTEVKGAINHETAALS